jgi:hypothetical protein
MWGILLPERGEDHAMEKISLVRYNNLPHRTGEEK